MRRASMAERVLLVLPTMGERLDLLTQMLESVANQIDVEIRLVAVVPPAAADARDLLRKGGATLVDDPRQGLSAAVNAGIDAADGEAYLAWAGDDDLYRPGGLSHLCALLHEHPRASAAYAGCDYIDDDGRVLRTSRFGRAALALLGWGPDLVPQPASLIRMTALDTVGAYDESLRYSMDLDMFLRLRRTGPLVSSRRVVAAFRWHADSLTVAQHDASTREAQAVKRRYLAAPLKLVAPVWEVPWRWLTRIAARNV